MDSITTSVRRLLSLYRNLPGTNQSKPKQNLIDQSYHPDNSGSADSPIQPQAISDLELRGTLHPVHPVNWLPPGVKKVY